MTDKARVFKRLLDRFETDKIRQYCEDMIEQIPDYIFTVPSSRSLKYHNATQCGEHGQIYHVLMFGEIMNYILGLEYVREKTTEEERDCMRCTPIFHDAFKSGAEDSGHTLHEHPLLAGKWVKETEVEHDIPYFRKSYIANLCEMHSGQWTTSDRSDIKLPKPNTVVSFLVHLCDYLSSRSNLDMIYDDEILGVLANFHAKEDDDEADNKVAD